MKDTSLVNDLFDVNDEFFNHQLFSKLIMKGHFDEVIHLMSQQKLDPYKTFKFKKDRSKDKIFTALFREAIESNNFDFIKSLLQYKPITKTAMTAFMKKVNVWDLIIDGKLYHSLDALNEGKNLAILASTCLSPILTTQKAYLYDEYIYSMVSKYFSPLLPEYQLFLTLYSNHSKDILSLDKNAIMKPLEVFNYYAKLQYPKGHNSYYYSNLASSTNLTASEKEFKEHYTHHFYSLISKKLEHNDLIQAVTRNENCIYATTLALLLNHDEVYCSLYNQLGKEEFKKQEAHNQMFFSSLIHTCKQYIQTSHIMLERYKLETDLFHINDLNSKKTQRIKI